MDVIATIYWNNGKYKLVSNWNDALAEGNINDICKALKAEDVKAKEKDNNKKSEDKK